MLKDEITAEYAELRIKELFEAIVLSDREIIIEKLIT